MAEGPELKKSKCSIISEEIYSKEFEQIFTENWLSETDIETENLEIISKPFKLCRISNFIVNKSFLEGIKNELLDIPRTKMSIDLYNFEQTQSLVNVDSTNLKLLSQAFMSDLAPWMERTTKVQLNKTLSMTGSCYSNGSYLLCHDDNIDDRRIAFILYLTKDWTKEDGGMLDMFDADKQGSPKDIVKSVFPEYNSIVFFEVVDNSYHRVSEVVSDKFRWSINGWFHGPLKTRCFNPPRPNIPFNLIKSTDPNVDLKYWINRNYLDPSLKEQIQQQVENKSYAFLSNFVSSDKYKELSLQLKSNDISWKKVGPMNWRNYEIAEEESLPGILKEFYNIFNSINVCKLLKDFTELDLVPDDDSTKPKMFIELQRWSRGCYSLIVDQSVELDSNSNNEKSISLAAMENVGSSLTNDTERIIPDMNDEDRSSNSIQGSIETDQEDQEEPDIVETGSLDLIVQFNTHGVPLENTIDYVDAEIPDGALIHIPSQDNHLCLVYRTLGTSRVHTYVNHSYKDYFYNLICTYRE